MKNLIIEAGLGLKSPLLSHLTSKFQTGVSVDNKKVEHNLRVSKDIKLRLYCTSLNLFGN